MSKKAAQEIVMDALRGIEHPEMPGINLVELEMIQGIKINDSIVEVNLALPKLCISIKSQLVASIQQAIQGTEENLEVKVLPWKERESSLWILQTKRWNLG